MISEALIQIWQTLSANACFLSGTSWPSTSNANTLPLLRRGNSLKERLLSLVKHADDTLVEHTFNQIKSHFGEFKETHALMETFIYKHKIAAPAHPLAQ